MEQKRQRNQINLTETLLLHIPGFFGQDTRAAQSKTLDAQICILTGARKRAAVYIAQKCTV